MKKPNGAMVQWYNLFSLHFNISNFLGVKDAQILVCTYFFRTFAMYSGYRVKAGCKRGEWRLQTERKKAIEPSLTKVKVWLRNDH